MPQREYIRNLYVGTDPVRLLENDGLRVSATLFDDVRCGDGIQLADSRAGLNSAAQAALINAPLHLRGSGQLWAQRPSGSTKLHAVLLIEVVNT